MPPAAGGALPANVIPIGRGRTRSVQMLRSDGQDKYAEFLDGLSDLAPQPGVHPGIFGALVPNEEEIRDLPEMQLPNVGGEEDLRRGAYGTKPLRQAVAPLAPEPQGAGGGEPPAAS